MAPTSNGKNTNIEDVAEQAFALISKGGQDRERGFALLTQRLYGRLKAYYRRKRVADADIEDLIAETWFKLSRAKFEGRTLAIIWIFRVARTVWLDKVRKKDPLAERPMGSGNDEFDGDQEEWDATPDTGLAAYFPPWARLCVQRATAQFEHDHPGRAIFLRMKVEGWSAGEIAVYLGATPPPSARQEATARERLSHALKTAREYFAHCKEET
jgi:DNA-directed RNA polymerase specialized sigma24 family protein